MRSLLVQFLKDLHFVSWEAAICSLQPGRRLWFRLSQSWSAQSRNFVDVHARRGLPCVLPFTIGRLSMTTSPACLP